MNLSDIKDRIKNRRLELGLTLEDVARKVGVSKPTVLRWESGDIANMRSDKISKLADALLTTPSYLMCWTDDPSIREQPSQFSNIFPIQTQRIPMLGEIACGKPIFAEEHRESYVQAGMNVHADFCLTARGDSMMGARIHDGDIVFCRSQSMVDNGEIAVVVIGDEATLKRVYFYPEKKKLVLQAENPKYEPYVFVGSELDDISILGKAVAFQSDVR